MRDDAATMGCVLKGIMNKQSGNRCALEGMVPRATQTLYLQVPGFHLRHL